MTNEINFRLKKRWSEVLLRRTSSVACPAQVSQLDGNLVLTVPTHSRVQVQNGLHWKPIHSGKYWGPLGAQVGRSGSSLNASDELTLVMPVASKARIFAKGRVWEVSAKPSATSQTSELYKKAALQTHRQQVRFLGYSLAGHLAAIVTLVSAPYLSEWVARKLRKTESKPVPTAQWTAPDPVQFGSVSQPFSGISYSEFRRSQQEKADEINPLGGLVSSLGKMDSSAGPVRLKTASRTTVGNLLSGAGIGDKQALLSDAIAAQKLEQSQRKANGERQLSPKEQEKLRAKAKEFQSEFRNVYLKVLAEDPGLSVTVAYQAQVQPSGFLSLVQFHVRGKYQTASEDKLKREFAQRLAATFVGTDLTGVGIKGESVFIK